MQTTIGVVDLVPEPASKMAKAREHAQGSGPADPGGDDAGVQVVQWRAHPSGGGGEERP